MYNKLKALPSTFIGLYLLIILPFLLLLPPGAQASNPEIRVLYKGMNEFSSEKYQLNSGEVLLTGSKFQILIDGLESGNYSLRLEFAGIEITTLIDEIKAEKRTRVYIPSVNNWLTLSNNIGDYKLVLSDNKNSKIVTEFPFLVLASRKKDSPLKGNASNNHSLKISNYLSIAKISPEILNQYLKTADRIYSKQNLIITRGVGAKIYREVAPAVAYIISYRKEKLIGTGSGIIINKQGIVITNHHVIENSDSIQVYIKPITRNYTEEIIASHIFSAKLIKVDLIKDLALIQMNVPPDKLSIVRLGTNDNILVGDDVHAIGHPEGSPWVYTQGTIGQVWPQYSWRTGSIDHKATVIQTQTPINPGSSGGPLLTDDGVVIGLNTFTRENLQNTNFAVSVGDINIFLESKISSNFPKNNKSTNKVRPSKVIKRLDLNNNGVVDAIIKDLDGDGKGDVLIKDIYEDGKNFSYHLDLDKDGSWETEVIEREFFRIYLIDTDNDGTADIAGYDYDKDGEIDKYQKY